MKKLTLVLALLVIALMSQSQVFVKNSNGEVINLNIKEDLQLIRLVGVSKGWTLNRLRLYIDYGQELVLKDDYNYIVDIDGNQIEFNSSVTGVMNYLEKNGWVYLNDAYTLTGTGSNGAIQVGVYNYTFRRKQ